MVHRLERILPVPVEAPLGHIAVHVLKPPVVGLPSAHGMGSFLGIELVPGHRIDGSVEFPGFAHTASVLPLSLRGQVPAPAGRNETLLMVKLRQLARELPSILPTDLFHRQIRTPELAGIMRHEQGPLRLSAGCLRKEKPIRQGDAMEHLIRLTVRLEEGSAHAKSPWWDPTSGPDRGCVPRR